MNPLTNARNQQALSERELELGLANTKSSWHDLHKDSAYVYAGGLPYDLSEGDVICVFSQYGEIVDINLIRDKATGKSKGFCFLAYEDQRSTVLAVDNLNTAEICGRKIRVQHVADYKVKQLKEKDLEDHESVDRQVNGVAPEVMNGHGARDIVPTNHVAEEKEPIRIKKEKKDKKDKKEKKSKKHRSGSREREQHGKRSRDRDRSMDRGSSSRVRDASKKSKRDR